MEFVNDSATLYRILQILFGRSSLARWVSTSVGDIVVSECKLMVLSIAVSTVWLITQSDPTGTRQTNPHSTSYFLPPTTGQSFIINCTLREYSRNVVIGYSLSCVNINILYILYIIIYYILYINVAYSVPFRFPASSIVGLGLGLVVGLGTVLVLFFFAFSLYRCMLKGRKLRPHQVPTPWHSG